MKNIRGIDRRTFITSLAVLPTIGLPALAQTSSWPQRPVRIIGPMRPR